MEIDNKYAGFYELICRDHLYDFLPVRPFIEYSAAPRVFVDRTCSGFVTVSLYLTVNDK